MKKTPFQRVSAGDLETTIDAGVQRAGAARELSADEVGAVSGGGFNRYVGSLARINPEWIGIWPKGWPFHSDLASKAQLDMVDGDFGPATEIGNPRIRS